MAEDTPHSRRWVLQSIGTGALAALAGCNFGSDPQANTNTSSPTRTRPSTATSTHSSPGTNANDQPPVIEEYEAEPRQNGTIVHVSMAGEDDMELETARIVYADREHVRKPDGAAVTMDATLEDTAATSPEDGRVVYVLTDAAGNETRQHVQPDDTAPELTVETRPTTNAGEVIAAITAEDNIGLAEVHVLHNGETVQNHDTAGSSEYNDERTVTVPQEQRFQRTPVGARAVDWNGNTTEQDVQTYVRKYDRDLADTRLDIGAIWISQQGGAFKQACRDSYEGIEPAVGIYDEDPIPTKVTTKHVDQMTGHGINRLVYDYGGIHYDVKRGRVQALLESPLINQIEIEPFYTKTGMLWRMNENWKKTVLPEALTYLRDTILSHANVTTIDDRPVVSTWNLTYFFDEDSDAHEKLLDEFGSYEAFVDDMRRHLRVDGTDPFLIVGKGPATVKEDTPIGDFVNLFDGMTTWFPPGPWRQGEEDSWDAIIDRVETYFENNYQYATDHDMEFTPRVFPGYDDRGSGCDRTGIKHIPRRPERLRQLLELAEQYTTRNRIDVATWNGWVEGHHIEPGTFKGTDYGTDYVEVIEKFQRGER